MSCFVCHKRSQHTCSRDNCQRSVCDVCLRTIDKKEKKSYDYDPPPDEGSAPLGKRRKIVIPEKRRSDHDFDPAPDRGSAPLNVNGEGCYIC